MNIHRFKIDEPALFQEAVDDIDWNKVSEYVWSNKQDLLFDYLYDHFEAFYETTNQKEAALDRHVDDQIDEALQRRAEFDSGFGDFVKKTFS